MIEMPFEEKIENIKAKEEEKKTEEKAKTLNLPYVNLTLIPINPEDLIVLPEEKARSGNLTIIQRAGKKLKVGLADPENPDTQKILEEFKNQGFSFSIFLVSRRGLKKAWQNYSEIKKPASVISKQVKISSEYLSRLQKEIKNIADLKEKIIELSSAKDTSKIIEIILAGALNIDASDIHLECEEKKAKLRYRIDGILEDIFYLEASVYNLLLSRIKLLSELKLNVEDVAQDGRFTIRAGNTDVEIRCSVIPAEFGENIVLRVLNPKAISLGLEDLGLTKKTYQILTQEIKKPNGMILNTGPTGSGKTTTLYACLKEAASPEIKIITLEDPIEYHLDGITQTQIAPEKDYTFAKGLRAVLRQDPDVILVGEIRDQETAEIATHAALTGHLVFSTLHTNDAAGAIPRLINLGVPSSILSPAINAIIAQRLIRKICPKCKEEYSPSKEDLEKIKKVLAGTSKNLKIPEKLARGKGCVSCNQSGYKGRLGIFEILVVDDEIEKLILSSSSIALFRETAVKKGMLTMKQDGFLKVLQHLTTIGEVERITGD